jgi:hypothetical protein
LGKKNMQCANMVVLIVTVRKGLKKEAMPQSIRFSPTLQLSANAIASVCRPTRSAAMINAYDVENIPIDDLYASTPLYGRYKAKEGDWSIGNLSPAEIYSLCSSDNEMIPDFNGRRIYAIGGVIVKGRHQLDSGIQISHRFGDANEVASIALVKDRFPWIPVPTIYFQGEVCKRRKLH